MQCNNAQVKYKQKHPNIYIRSDLVLFFSTIGTDKIQ